MKRLLILILLAAPLATAQIGRFPMWTPTVAVTASGVALDDTTFSVGNDARTASHTVAGTNRVLLAFAITDGSVKWCTGVTWNGTAMDSVGVTQWTAGYYQVKMYRLIDPETGTHDCVATFSGGPPQETALGVISLTGVNQTTPLGTIAAAKGEGASNDSTIVTISCGTGDFLVAAVSSNYNTPTVFANATELFGMSGIPRMRMLQASPSGSSVSTGWVLDMARDNWAVIGVAVKPL